MADRARRKRRRLSRSGEFDRVYREGRSHASRHLVVYAFPRADADSPRLGVSVGRKLGGAVERNRVKRLLREAFWARADELPDGHDFVIVARPDAGELARDGGGRAIEEALRAVLEDAGLAVRRASRHDGAARARGGARSASTAARSPRDCRAAASTIRPARRTPWRRSAVTVCSGEACWPPGACSAATRGATAEWTSSRTRRCSARPSA